MLPLPSLWIERGGVRTELVNAEDQDGLVDLESEDFWLNEGKRLSVNLDETLSGLNIIVSILFDCALVRGIAYIPCSGRQLLVRLLASVSSQTRRWVARTSRGLLLAEALHTLGVGGHIGRLWMCVRLVGRRRFCGRQGEVGDVDVGIEITSVASVRVALSPNRLARCRLAQSRGLEDTRGHLVKAKSYSLKKLSKS